MVARHDAAIGAAERLLGDRPRQAGRRERVGERVRALVEHDAEAVPGHAAHAHHRIGVGDPVSHSGSPPWWLVWLVWGARFAAARAWTRRGPRAARNCGGA